MKTKQDPREWLKSILVHIKEGHSPNRSDVQERVMVETMYRKGILTMESSTGKLLLSSYGEEFLNKLG